MPIVPTQSRRLVPAFSRAPALLASTCVTALLLGAPAQAGQTITTPQTSVSNAAGHSTTSIVITNTTVSGGFGALSVNATDSNSFQTTLGARLTSRIETASGVFVPELRVGWIHELLDASQSFTATLVGVPGSSFNSTAIAFGRDAALIGAGFSLELSPDAKVFVDYDGRLGARLQEHAISGGLKVRF